MDLSQHDDLEGRIRKLEQAMARINNPGTISTAEAVSLKEYFNSRLTSIENATSLAAATMDKRLDGMNEFRDTLRDQAGRFTTREEVGVQIARVCDLASADRASLRQEAAIERKALKDQIDELQTFKDRLEGKASTTSVAVSYLLGGASLLIGILGLLLR